MAKRRTRALSEADRAVLQNIEQAYPGSTAYAEKNGKIDPRVQEFFKQMSKSDPDGAQKQLDRYTSLAETVGKKYTRPELETFLETTKNEADLTPQELEDRLEAFQEIGGTTTGTPENLGGLTDFIANEIDQQIKGQVGTEGLSADTFKGLADLIAKTYLSGRDISDQELAEKIKNESGVNYVSKDFERIKKVVVPKVKEAINRDVQNFKSTVSGPVDVSADVKRIQDQLDTYKTQAEKEGALTSYLNALPAELQGQTDERLRGLYSRAQEGFEQDVKPRLRAGANVRGMLFSGDVQDLEATEAANIQADLESTRAGLEQSDYDFYFNAAYQDTVRKLLDANTNFRSALDTERGRVMTDRATRFQESQDELNRRQSERLTEQDYNLKLQSQRSRMNRDRDIASDKNRNDLINTGLGVVGTVG